LIILFRDLLSDDDAEVDVFVVLDELLVSSVTIIGIRLVKFLLLVVELIPENN